jgi:hypothetical protein
VVPAEVITDRAPTYPVCWTSCGRLPGSTPSNTPTTGSRPTTPS